MLVEETNTNKNPLIIGGGFADEFPVGLTREEYYAKSKSSTNYKSLVMGFCFLIIGIIAGIAIAHFLLWPHHNSSDDDDDSGSEPKSATKVQLEFYGEGY
mmetsp:Transcript_30502/g.35978  ORF Transcript_30502/g.35978 Transcript_30502/m.35978 type:complete len:100 (+) Transcript_30502:17-316(+)